MFPPLSVDGAQLTFTEVLAIAQIQGPGLEGATNLNFKKRIGLSCETLLPAAIALT
jgi:hypothetical protein